MGVSAAGLAADIVLGDHAPQGRLPVSFPQASGQEPFFYNHRRTGRPQQTQDKAYRARYREVPNEPLYPFGYGLTYSRIAYGETRVEGGLLKAGSTLSMFATVTNSGPRAAHEVAQLYIHDRVASITQPVRLLKGVQHLDLAPGETRTVTFTLRADDLGYVHEDMKTIADPGAFDVWIAPSSIGGSAATFILSA